MVDQVDERFKGYIAHVFNNNMEACLFQIQ